MSGELVPELLETIFSRIKRDPKGSGFSGRVALGVKSDAAVTTWLIVTCGEPCVTEWSRWYPDEHDAAFGVDQAAASALLAGQKPPPGSMCIRTGDTSLLQRFIDRYFGAPQGLSPLGLRVQAATSGGAR